MNEIDIDQGKLFQTISLSVADATKEVLTNRQAERISGLQTEVEQLRKLATYLLACRDVQSQEFSREAFLLVEAGNREWSDEKIKALLVTPVEEQTDE